MANNPTMYRRIQFAHAVQFENGHNTAYVQCFDKYTNASYVKSISRVGNSIFIEPWSDKEMSHAAPRGSKLEASMYQMIYAQEWNEQDHRDFTEHGHLTCDRERKELEAAKRAATLPQGNVVPLVANARTSVAFSSRQGDD